MSREDFQPLIPPEKSVAELTLKAVLVGVVLAIVMGSANAYLGLYAGMTVSAAIPGAIMALAVLKAFRPTALEVTVGMMGAAAGEALAAGVIFTIPALVVIGAWTNIHYLETTLIALIGGILGVLWMVMLRRALIVKTDLPFPEGIAVAAVINTAVGDTDGGDEPAAGGGSIWMLIGASLAGFVKFSQVSLEIFKGRVEEVWSAGKYHVLGKNTEGHFYGGIAASPALLGVGYIIGFKISSFVFAGGLLGWVIITPLLLVSTGVQSGMSPYEAFMDLWSSYVRYLGVGAMVVGGIYTIWKLRENLIHGVKEAVIGLRGGQVETKIRTEKDLDIKKVFLAIGFMIIPIFLVYAWISEMYVISLFMAIFLVLLAFVASAIAGYMAGLLGSSNNPISGVTVSVLLFVSIIMLAFGVTGTEGMIIVIAMAAVVCCAAAISGDVLQSMAAGQMLGATPWKQQMAELFGIIASAPILALVVSALDEAYTIGSANLPAPQAFLMGGIVQGVIGGDMVWPFVIAGAFLALVLILMDIPVLPVAIGIYLPFTLAVPILIGGIVRLLVDRRLNGLSPDDGEDEVSDWEMAIKKSGVKPKETAHRTGLLFAAGLIAGEALLGVISAFLIIGNIDLSLIGDAPAWPGMLVWGYIAFLLGYIVLREYRKASHED
jgi:putative OPT family oligopeptide transporter